MVIALGGYRPGAPEAFPHRSAAMRGQPAKACTYAVSSTAVLPLFSRNSPQVFGELDPCAGLFQRDIDTAEICGEFHSRFKPLQIDPHTLFICQVNASDAANQGAAAADRTVGAGKVACLAYA